MPGPWDARLVLLDGQTLTGSTASGGVYVGEGAELRVQLEVAGTVSGTAPTLDVRVQDSADGASWADTGVAFATVTATVSRQQRELRVRRGRPYVRVAATVGGSGASFGGVSVRLGHWSGPPTTVAAP
ncbi:MAG TPA: hypothetical protein VKZ60_19980 [Chloroflexota bacterium]|nr:hypothetical protein [Chloroflexota bacterium]